MGTGHLIYANDGVLRAVPFDPATGQTTGIAAPVEEGILTSADGGAGFAVARNGTLFYMSGKPAASDDLLVLVGRDGNEEPLALPGGVFFVGPRLSPDGTRVALNDVTTGDVEIRDLSREGVAKVTTSGARDGAPLWTPEGNRIVFRSDRDDTLGLYMKPADGTGVPVRLMEMRGATELKPMTWSQDARELVFDYRESDTASWNVGRVAMDGDGAWTPLLATVANERNAAVSPASGFIAYQSDLSGRPEVYLERFPALTDRQPVSTNGGIGPVWSHDGRELFFRDESGALLVAAVGRNGLEESEPETIFDGSRRYAVGMGFADRQYDVGPDGSFLFFKRRTADTSGAQLILVLNWLEELKRLVPTN